jgi:hypothetical protein
LNKTFWHQTVTGAQIEHYISQQAGVNLSKVFDQYLRTINVPKFEYRIVGDSLSYRWSNVVPGFDMPMKVALNGRDLTVVHPTETWKTARLALATPADFKVDVNFYVVPTNVDAPAKP